MSFELAREVLGYAKAELEKALRTGDMLLYRSAADKAFLALVIAVNAYVRAIGGAEPASHSERRLPGKMRQGGPGGALQRPDEDPPRGGALRGRPPARGGGVRLREGRGVRRGAGEGGKAQAGISGGGSRLNSVVLSEK